MTSIVLDEQQSQAISAAQDSIELRDQQGRRLGYFTRVLGHGFTDEDIELALKRRQTPGPRYSTQQVLERLDQLKGAG